jgi:hypothetical protein
MENYFNNLRLSENNIFEKMPQYFCEKEVSLEDIFFLHKEGFYDNTGLNANLIDEIIKDINLSWSKGQYYLYGNINIDPDTKITHELINFTDTYVKNKYKEYGDPCNSFEAASIQRTHNNFKDLCQIIHYTKTKFKAKVE